MFLGQRAKEGGCEHRQELNCYTVVVDYFRREITLVMGWNFALEQFEDCIDNIDFNHPPQFLRQL